MKNQEKEILIDQIMGLLSSNTGINASQHDSLRFSVDYEPQHYRYTKEDQIQDIKFEFLDQDEGHQKLASHHYKDTRALPQEAVVDKTQQREYIEAKTESERKRQLSRQRLRDKNTMKLGQLIKRKISEKEQSDQFTKKYDNLFDEVFKQSKLKTSKKESQKKPTSPAKDTVANSKTDSKAISSKLPSGHKTIGRKQFVEHTMKAPEDKMVNQPKKADYDTHQPIRIILSQPASLVKVQTHHQLLKHPENPSSFLSTESKNSQFQSQLQSKTNIKFTDSVLQDPSSLRDPQSKVQSSIVQPQAANDRNKKLQETLPVDKIGSTSRERKLSDSLGQSQSTKSLQDSNCSIPELITRDNFEAIVQQFSHKPHLIQALKPPVKVTYHNKKEVVVIKPTHLLPPPNNPSVSGPNKPTVKFCYGKSQQSFSTPNQNKSVPKVQAFLDFNIKQEVRLPKFLRKLRELTNSYPNFYSSKTFTNENVKNINRQLFEAFEQAKRAIKTLKVVHLRYHELIKLIKELYQRISKNVDEGGKEDKGLLQFFTQHDWNNFANYTDINSIKPCDLFEKRTLNELQFMTLLNSYEQLINSIEEEEVLKIGYPQSVKKYMEYRDKLWAIEKNLRIMSEDFYLKAIIRIHIPQHIADADRIIHQGKALSENDRKSQLDRLLFLQERRDMFSCSCLGNHAIKLLLQNH